MLGLKLTYVSTQGVPGHLQQIPQRFGLAQAFDSFCVTPAFYMQSHENWTDLLGVLLIQITLTDWQVSLTPIFFNV